MQEFDLTKFTTKDLLDWYESACMELEAQVQTRHLVGIIRWSTYRAQARAEVEKRIKSNGTE